MQRALRIGLLVIALAMVPAASAADSGPDRYRQTNLVSDISGLAVTTDASLVNPWGIASSGNSPFWVSDNGTGLSTLYNSAGVKQSTVVTIPPPVGSPPGTISKPTGVVFNTVATTSPTDFVVTGGTSRFIFATEDGTIAGWPGSGSAAFFGVNNPNPDTGPIYKGLALASTGGKNYLYAADFRGGKIDVFNGSFALATLTGTFHDPGIPAGFAPFNIQNLGGQLYVTYAKQDEDKEDDVAGRGNGFVSIFNTDGTFVRRFASGDPLNSPWGLAMAPPQFGRFSGAVLVGNFGDGRINAFSAAGSLLGTLKNTAGRDLIIDGLWGLRVGNGGNGGDPNTVYFAAGLDHEAHGLFGALSLAPDLTVEQSVQETGPFTAGQIIHYVITVHNTGGAMDPAEKVFLMDRLPAGMGFHSATGAGVSCTFTSPDVACEHAALAGGGQFTIQIEAQIPSRLPGDRTLTNQVEVDPKHAVTETDTTNNKSQLSIHVQ